MFFSTLYQSFELTLNIVIFGLPYSTKVTCFASLIFSLDCAKVQPRFSEFVSTSQRSGSIGRFVQCFTLQILPLRLMRTSSLHFQPPTATTLTVGAVRGWKRERLGRPLTD